MKNNFKLTFQNINDIFKFFKKIKIYNIFKIHISLSLIIDNEKTTKSIKSFIYNDFNYLQTILNNEIENFLIEYNQSNSTINEYLIDILILSDDENNVTTYKNIILNEYNESNSFLNKIKYKIVKIIIILLK